MQKIIFAYFMRENLLAKSEEDEVRRLYVKFDNQ